MILRDLISSVLLFAAVTPVFLVDDEERNALSWRSDNNCKDFGCIAASEVKLPPGKALPPLCVEAGVAPEVVNVFCAACDYDGEKTTVTVKLNTTCAGAANPPGAAQSTFNVDLRAYCTECSDLNFICN